MTVPVFFLIDLVWLGVVARDFYRSQIGSLMADPIVWWAAILFYLVLIVGIVFFAVGRQSRPGAGGRRSGSGRRSASSRT